VQAIESPATAIVAAWMPVLLISRKMNRKIGQRILETNKARPTFKNNPYFTMPESVLQQTPNSGCIILVIGKVGGGWEIRGWQG
jgi:hypothetical protein